MASTELVGGDPGSALKRGAARVRAFLAVYAPIAACIAGSYATAVLLHVSLWSDELSTGVDPTIERVALAFGGALGAFLMMRFVRWRSGKALVAGMIGLVVCPDLGMLTPGMPGNFRLLLSLLMLIACILAAVVVRRPWSARLGGLLVALVPVLVLPVMFGLLSLAPSAGYEGYPGILMIGVTDPPFAAVVTASLVLFWSRNSGLAVRSPARGPDSTAL